MRMRLDQAGCCLLGLLMVSWSSAADNVQEDQVILESRELGLCGAYATTSKSTLIERFEFGDGNSVQVVSMGQARKRSYFVHSGRILINVEGEFLTLQLNEDGKLFSTAMWAAGIKWAPDSASTAQCALYSVADNSQAALALDLCYLSGNDLMAKDNFADANLRFGDCCLSGDSRSCHRLGFWHERREQDLATARTWYDRACAQEHIKSCVSLAGVEQKLGNLEDAREVLKGPCSKGNKEACLELRLLERRLSP